MNSTELFSSDFEMLTVATDNILDLIKSDLTEEKIDFKNRFVQLESFIKQLINIKDKEDISELEFLDNLNAISSFFKSFKNDYKSNYSKTIQSWKGRVTNVRENNFDAVLEDLTNPGTSESAEFDFKDISEDDKKLIETGSVFYWSISSTSRSGQISKESIIRFQRLAKWDEEHFDRAADRAADLSKKMIFD